METCANCERQIGNLEPAHVHNNAILCNDCFQRLTASQPPVAAPQPRHPNNAAPPPATDAVATLIPFRNPYALTAYYLGLFSLFPCIGAVMGVVAIFLGIKGLKAANANPQAKGKVHAIVGIVCGAIFGLGWIVLDAAILIGLIMRPH
jgi:hypothetical protein